ncbi:MAG TPA: galactokinase family protein, partial [Herpetosiphonaceae bacterium]
MTDQPTTLEVWSPGRVNLIGDHTDYNDGWVLPLAIDLGTTVRASRRPDQTLVSTSSRVGETDRIALAEIAAGPFEGWRAYVRGTAQALIDAGHAPPGAELTIDSTIPTSGGLSSSASLEIGVALALLALKGESLPADRLALLAQGVEHRYAGVKCGIMDQLAVAAGVPGHALLIDCRSLAVEPVPLPAGAAVLIIESGAPRTLAGSAYNERRAQCDAAVAALRQLDPAIAALRDASPALLAEANARGVIEGLIH